MSSQNYAKVYFPDDGYYDFYDDTFYPRRGEKIVEATNSNPESKLPVFVKAGSVIPMHKIIQSTADDPGDTLFLHIYKGSGTTTFTYYEDDGISFKYRDGQYYKRLIRYDAEDGTLVLEPADGQYASHYKSIKIVFHGFPEKPSSIAIDYASQKGRPEVNNLDLVLSNDAGQTTVTWK